MPHPDHATRDHDRHDHATRDPHRPSGPSVASGGGLLTTGTGSGKVTVAVTTPIALGDGNHRLIDNEINAVITGGNGNNTIIEFGAGASIAMGNGNTVIRDAAGSADIIAGTGDQSIELGGTGNSVTVGDTMGGAHDRTEIQAGSGGATVIAGNGNMEISASGANNSVSVGTGNDIIVLGNPGGGHGEDRRHGHMPAATATPVTADTVNLGNGVNLVFLGGSGNIIRDGNGTDTIFATAAGNDSFLLNGAGGTDTIGGFSLTNGDKLDLTQILAGTSLAADLSNLGGFVTVGSQADLRHAGWIDTTLSIAGTVGTANVTLLNTGSMTLANLVSAGSLVLPPH